VRYPIVIEPGDETAAFGVIVPDLPGCFSAGDTLDEAMAAVEEAAAAWIDATLDAGGAVPPPSDLEDVRRNPAYAGRSGYIAELTLADADPKLPSSS
jgi:predicted RNase H-like HicB family nuclease